MHLIYLAWTRRQYQGLATLARRAWSHAGRTARRATVPTCGWHFFQNGRSPVMQYLPALGSPE